MTTQTSAADPQAEWEVQDMYNLMMEDIEPGMKLESIQSGGMPSKADKHFAAFDHFLSRIELYLSMDDHTLTT